MEKPWAVILAAGAGTRMNSCLPKVLHLLCGKPLLWYVLASAQEVSDRQVIVTGLIRTGKRIFWGEICLCSAGPAAGNRTCTAKSPALPPEQEKSWCSAVIPLLKGSVLNELITLQRKNEAAATVLTAVVEDPTGYGRVIRSPKGE